jgi:hypothetical protein
VIKCGVCGSENEAQALFCGTCGSPLAPAEAAPVPQETKPTPIETAAPDESVVPGKGGARRDLGIGDAGTKPVRTEPVGPAEVVTTDTGTEIIGPTIVCAVCGTVNEASRTYCRKCANELKAAAAAPPPPPPPSPRRGLSPTIIGLGAAGVVVAVGVAVVLALGGLGPSATSTPPPASSGPTAVVTTGPDGGTAEPSQATEPSKAPFEEAAPEGRIVYSRCTTRTECVLFMMNANGSDVGPLTSLQEDGSASDPAFSFDGTKILFTLPGGISVLIVESGEIIAQTSTEGDISPAWAPDGNAILFAGHRDSDPEAPRNDLEIRLDRVDGGPSQPLTANKIQDHDAVFTLDDRVIWSQGEGDGRRLKIIDVGSRAVSNLTSAGFGDVDPAVSPDGKLVAFASKRNGAGEFDLFLLDLESLAITPLPTIPGDEHDPAWSPGGRYLVFSGGPQENRDLFLLDRADMSIKPLAASTDREVFPTWAR